ncbi:XkdN-like protein (plasmid) [Clostridiaceae bacterium 14S0207]|nr:XkdN-like protein [Clostridiaceae bacterium 14S0207]
MNTVERLLALDMGAIKAPEKEVKLKLGKLGGQEFTFPCKAVNNEKIARIQTEMLELNKKGELKELNTGEMKLNTVIEGCPDVFKNQDLLKHYNVPSFKDLVNLILLPGEVDELYNIINELNGYEKDEEEIEDIKN